MKDRKIKMRIEIAWFAFYIFYIFKFAFDSTTSISIKSVKIIVKFNYKNMNANEKMFANTNYTQKDDRCLSSRNIF